MQQRSAACLPFAAGKQRTEVLPCWTGFECRLDWAQPCSDASGSKIAGAAAPEVILSCRLHDSRQVRMSSIGRKGTLHVATLD